MLESGELAQRTFKQYYEVCELAIATIGKIRAAHDIQPDDFAALRGVMAKRRGPIRLGNKIQFTRSIFKYGWEAGLLPTPPRYGVSFKKPSAKTLRKVRTAVGPKLFTREQILSLLNHSPAIFKAMVLLGINGALGNTELGMLTTNAIDLDGGWLNYARAKTATSCSTAAGWSVRAGRTRFGRIQYPGIEARFPDIGKLPSTRQRLFAANPAYPTHNRGCACAIKFSIRPRPINLDEGVRSSCALASPGG